YDLDVECLRHVPRSLIFCPCGRRTSRSTPRRRPENDMTRQQIRQCPALIVMLTAALLLAAAQHTAVAAQQSVPGVTPEEMRTYSAFRTWITSQGPDLQAASDDTVFERYSAELRRQGKSDPEVASTIALLRKVGDRAEAEMWN